MNPKKLLDFLKNNETPLTLPQIARGLGLPRTALKPLNRILKQMVSAGQLVCLKDKQFALPDSMELVVGRLQVHPNGYGFLIPEKPGEPDVFISSHNLQEVQDGDKVAVRIDSVKAKGKREGSIVRIIERARQQIVGRYERDGRIGYVTPLDPKLNRDIIIPRSKGLKAEPGQLVVVKILNYASRQGNAEGELVEVLGDKNTPGIDTEAVIRTHNLRVEFPNEVLAEAEKFPDKVEEFEHRLDLRKQIIFTIDGETARDFDDAISISSREDGGWRLGVHIADVSHYVTPDSALDKEAYERGCSVYFPDRVLPMLPEKLSNGLCSLKPGVDRLTLSAIMDFNPHGELVHHEIVDSVICSTERMTYTAVKKILEDNDPKLCERYAHILPTLQEMAKLAKILKERRLEQGSLDFDLPEPEIIIDLQGNIQDIVKRERNFAHELIEDFMLAANCTVATHMTNLELPFIYRIHEKPDPEKLCELAEFVKNFGYDFTFGADIKPTDLQKLMLQLKDKLEETVITINMLRSLKLARYSTKNMGHFGLAMSFYTHFTSPIRRYPDLIVHRLLRQAASKKKLNEAQVQHKGEQLEAVALQSSTRERIAEKAERDIISIKRTQFMAGKLGEEFSCIVAGVSNFGLFIELEDLYIEGLIHVNNMRDDYYDYLEREQAMVGKRTHQRYQLGDKLIVQVEKVNIERRQIDFNIVKRLEENATDHGSTEEQKR